MLIAVLVLCLLAVHPFIIYAILVVQKLVDDLILMHLLDQLEEAPADEVLACLNAIQRRLQQEENEIESVLVVAVSCPLLFGLRAVFDLIHRARTFDLQLLRG